MLSSILGSAMKKLMIAVPIVLVLMMPFAFPAQGQPSIQRFNDTPKLVESGLSHLAANGNIQHPQTPSEGATVLLSSGKAILDITGIQIDNSGNVTFSLRTPDWVTVRNQPSILYLQLQGDDNSLVRQKMYDLLFYAFSNKQDVSIRYDQDSKVIQVVNVAQ
jgi:hypothetical protein